MSIKGTVSFMHKKVKYKGSSGSCLVVFLSINSHSSGDFHSIEKNKISKSKQEFRLPKTEKKAFH